MEGQQLELGVPRTNEEDLRREPQPAGAEDGAPETEGIQILRNEQIEEFWKERDIS